MDVLDEQWLPITGYEDFYEISSYGRVRSKSVYITTLKGRQYHRKCRILKAYKASDGYLKTILTVDGKQKTFLIHRLVAQAFIPNPSNLPLVNHKDENKTNNRVENLEWCDNSYNMRWNGLNRRISNKLKGRRSHRARAVKNVTTGEVYQSIGYAANSLHIRFSKAKDMLDKHIPYKGIVLEYEDEDAAVV